MKKKHRDAARIDHREELKRLSRLAGQIEGVRGMLEESRRLEDVLNQCKAVRSGLKSVEARIIKAHLEVALEELAKTDKKKTRVQKAAELEALFKQAS